jgi:hypothetical protein
MHVTGAAASAAAPFVLPVRVEFALEQTVLTY